MENFTVMCQEQRKRKTKYGYMGFCRIPYPVDILMNSSELTSRLLFVFMSFCSGSAVEEVVSRRKKKCCVMGQKNRFVLLASDHEASGNGKPIKLTEICEGSFTKRYVITGQKFLCGSYLVQIKAEMLAALPEISGYVSLVHSYNCRFMA